MKKSIEYLIAIPSLLINSGEYNIEYNDSKVNECLMDMYFYMLYNGENNEEKKKEYFQEFENKYNKLNKEQQEQVKQEYINIIEAQKKNRGKIKKKGMIDYE